MFVLEAVCIHNNIKSNCIIQMRPKNKVVLTCKCKIILYSEISCFLHRRDMIRFRSVRVSSTKIYQRRSTDQELSII